MLWIYLVLIAQAINAGVFMLDKYLVGPKMAIRPRIYTFYMGLLSGVVVLLLPFKVVLLPSGSVIWLSLAYGGVYMLSLFLLYRSLQQAEASDVAPVMGAVTALATWLFSFFLLGDKLTKHSLIAFVLLVTGMALMSYFRFRWRVSLLILGAGVLFGLSFVLIKMIFTQTTFFNGFFWSRMANVLAVLIFMLWPGNFRAINGHWKASPLGTKSLVVVNKFFAGIAFFLIFLAVDLGDVSLVNALSGLQFVFLMVLAFLLVKKFPAYFSESLNRKTILAQKSVATILIVWGYFMLFR